MEVFINLSLDDTSLIWSDTVVYWGINYMWSNLDGDFSGNIT